MYPWSHYLTTVSVWPVSGHGSVMAWKRFVHHWSIVRGIHLCVVYSPHKGTVVQSLDMFWSLAWTGSLTYSRAFWWFETSCRSNGITIMYRCAKSIGNVQFRRAVSWLLINQYICYSYASLTHSTIMVFWFHSVCECYTKPYYPRSLVADQIDWRNISAPHLG